MRGPARARTRTTRVPFFGRLVDAKKGGPPDVSSVTCSTSREIEVKAGDALPLVCAHNTVQMQFSVPEAEYLHLRKLDASFPQYHFAMLADERRARAYDEAIQRRVGEVTKRDGEARVLDVGAGSGLLSMMAARAGARSALACEWHGSLAACARRNVAANRMSASSPSPWRRGEAAAGVKRPIEGVTWSSSICSTRA